MEEIIKPHSEYGSYLVSNFGYVIGPTGTIHRPKATAYRPTYVKFKLDGLYLVEQSIERIVASHFRLKEPFHNTVAFMDGNITNCRADNVFWTMRTLAIAHHKKVRRRL